MDPIIETPTSSRLRTTNPNSRLAQPDLASDRIVLSDDLRLYIRHAWHVVEPSTVYLENWHIDLIAEYLEAVTLGQIKRLLINLPPRYPSPPASRSGLFRIRLPFLQFDQKTRLEALFENGLAAPPVRIHHKSAGLMLGEAVDFTVRDLDRYHRISL